MDLLVAETRGGVEGCEVLPGLCGLADLLRQLPLRGRQHVLPVLVELACRELEKRRFVRSLTGLAHHPELLAVVRHDRDRARMADYLALDLLAVGVAVAVDADARDAPAPYLLSADPLERHSVPPRVPRRPPGPHERRARPGRSPAPSWPRASPSDDSHRGLPRPCGHGVYRGWRMTRRREAPPRPASAAVAARWPCGERGPGGADGDRPRTCAARAPSGSP